MTEEKSITAQRVPNYSEALESGPSKAGYLRTLQGRGQLSRYLADVVEVAFIRRSTEYHAVRETTVYFDSKRGKLVRIGNEIGCTCGYPLHEVDPAALGSAFHWEGNAKAQLVATFFGVAA